MEGGESDRLLSCDRSLNGMKGILWARLQSHTPLTPLYPNGEPHHLTLRYGAERCWGFWLKGVHFVAVAQEG
uniref:hypothetical protein n=1 Tax=Trichocoleus desertorum TaxID=1481672 RepID=UPI0025B57AF9|nr:hypothetical protein [Trichocoleus desertorum]